MDDVVGLLGGGAGRWGAGCDGCVCGVWVICSLTQSDVTLGGSGGGSGGWCWLALVVVVFLVQCGGRWCALV